MSWSKLIPLGLLIAVGVFVWKSQPQQQAIVLTGSTMGTTYEVTIRQLPESITAEQLQDRVETVLADVNQRYSHYDPDSEISQFNQSESTDWFEIELSSVGLYRYCNTIHSSTNGAFDITLEPVLKLWKFSHQDGQFTLPTNEQVSEALSQCGMEKLNIRRGGGLQKTDPELSLNLSAIAKGYGVDKVAELLDAVNIDDFLVNIGGEVIARGTRDGSNGWRLGIEKPVSGERAVQKVVELDNLAMATSGSYRNFYEVDGIRYSHTIDPRTGKPVTHKLHSVSVIAESCLFADAWATAIMVMGPEEGMQWAYDHQVEAFIIYESDTGTMVEEFTPGFPFLKTLDD